MSLKFSYHACCKEINLVGGFYRQGSGTHLEQRLKSRMLGRLAVITPTKWLNIQRIDELPQAAQNYIAKIEELVGVPVDIVSTDPDRIETIIGRDPFSI